MDTKVHGLRRKTQIVLRVRRGQDLDALSRELAVTAATIAGWRDQFLASGQAGPQTRPREPELLVLRRPPSGLARTCRVLEIARSAVYAHRARRLRRVPLRELRLNPSITRRLSARLLD